MIEKNYWSTNLHITIMDFTILSLDSIPNGFEYLFNINHALFFNGEMLAIQILPSTFLAVLFWRMFINFPD